MVDRSVKVRLDAEVGGYISAMGRAEQATTKLSTAGQTATKQSRDWDGLASGLGKFGLAAGAGIGLAVKTFADFDAVMSQVKANSGATGSELDALEMSIRAAGKASVFSATEAAEGANELAKAGMSASDIMGGALTGSLNLAAAGQVSMGRAAEISANAMSVFGLKASDASHVADVFANGANASTASVDSLAMGLSQSGAVAAAFGLSLDETVGVLSQFDQAGLKGSDAGTSLKSMLQALVNPSKKASTAMQELGINAFDAQGNFVGLDGLAGQLKTSMSGLTQEQRGQAMATIFGSDAVRAANILFKDGADKTAEWAKRMGLAGAAGDLAAKNVDNLKGDLEQLKGALEDLVIGGTGGFADGLRPIVQFLTDLLNLVGQIPAPIMTTVLALTAMAAAGALAGSAGIKLVQGWQNLRSTLSTFASGASAARAALDGVVASQRNLGATSGAVSGGMQRAATAAAGLSNAQRGIVTTSSGAAVQMGRFGTAVSSLGAKAPTIAGLQKTFVSTAEAADRLPRTAGAAATAVDAVGRAAKFAGPALLLAAAAMTKMGNEQENVGRSSAQLTSDMIGTKTGAIDLNSVFKDLQIAMSPDSSMSFADGLKQATTASGRANDQIGLLATGFGLLGDGAKSTGDAVRTRLKAMGDELARMVSSGNGAQAAQIFSQMATEANKAGVSTDQLKKLMPGYTAALADAANQQKLAGSSAMSATSGVGQFATSAVKAGVAAAKAAEDTKAWKNSLDNLGSALLGMRGSQRGYQEALDAGNAALKENGKTLDITTDKGRANQAALDGIATSTASWAKSTYESTGSMQQAQSVLNAGSAQFVKLAQAMGMSKTQAQTLAAELFKLPPTVETGVNVDGVDQAIYKVDELGNIVISLAGRKVTIPAETTNAEQVAQTLLSIGTAALAADGKTVSIPISSLGGEATQSILNGVKGARKDANGNVIVDVDEIGGDEVTNALRGVANAARTANGQSVLIPASTPNAAKVAQALNGISAAAVTADAKSVNITTSAPLAPSVKAKINAIEGATVSADSKSVRVDTSAPNSAGTVRQINGILSAANQADAKSVNIFTSTNANSTAAQLRGLMSAATSKTVFIRTVMQTVNDQRGGRGGTRYGQEMADGGILNGAGVRTFANGGFENHVAQIAPAGAWRVWAEPETGGEAYIPLAAGKRARSMDILERTAALFGRQVVPRAAGGIDKQQLSAMRAWQPSRTATVTVAAPSSPLDARDLARLARAIDRLPAAVAAASEAGTRRGASMRESDRTHDLRRDLRRGGMN